METILQYFRAMFGWVLRSAENPELLLNQLIDDLKEKVPVMRNKVSQLVAGEKELEIRRASFKPVPHKYTSGVLGKFVKLVGSASKGAVCD